MLKTIRISFWIIVVLAVLWQLWEEYQILQWRRPLYVALYPVNADGDAEVERYINELTQKDFMVLEDYFSEEAKRYHLGIRRPVMVRLGSVVKAVPPAPPPVDGALLDIIHWSLNFRFFSWRNQPDVGVPPDIKLYLLYYNVGKYSHLQHSTALNKGRIGRVNLFADARHHGVNMVVTAHELLHTLKATDKYNLVNNEPLFPQGYVEPYAQPVYPQSMAEIMAGRIPQSAQHSRMAQYLSETIVGRKTAREIGWIK